MTTQSIIESIDKQIAVLRQARSLLTVTAPAKRKYTKRKPRTMSAAAKKKISYSMKKRWAKKAA